MIQPVPESAEAGFLYEVKKNRTQVSLVYGKGLNRNLFFYEKIFVISYLSRPSIAQKNPDGQGENSSVVMQEGIW